MVSPERNTDI